MAESVENDDSKTFAVWPIDEVHDKLPALWNYLLKMLQNYSDKNDGSASNMLSLCHVLDGSAYNNKELQINLLYRAIFYGCNLAWENLFTFYTWLDEYDKAAEVLTKANATDDATPTTLWNESCLFYYGDLLLANRTSIDFIKARNLLIRLISLSPEQFRNSEETLIEEANQRIGFIDKVIDLAVMFDADLSDLHWVDDYP